MLPENETNSFATAQLLMHGTTWQMPGEELSRVWEQ
jgi:hypothetical protein